MKRNKPSKLERDEEGKPKINLTPLEQTAVNTRTQQQYDILMQVYECGGWRRFSGAIPTSWNHWNQYKKETSVMAGICYYERGKFIHGLKENYISQNWKVLSTQEFYDAQKITLEQLGEINDYFAKQGRRK